MKYLLLLLMTGCSLIKIQEGSPEPKHRPEILTVSAHSCAMDSKQCDDIVEVSISRSKIVYFREDKGSCYVALEGTSFGQELNMTCNEFKEYLNQ